MTLPWLTGDAEPLTSTLDPAGAAAAAGLALTLYRLYRRNATSRAMTVRSSSPVDGDREVPGTQAQCSHCVWAAGTVRRKRPAESVRPLTAKPVVSTQPLSLPITSGALGHGSPVSVSQTRTVITIALFGVAGSGNVMSIPGR